MRYPSPRQHGMVLFITLVALLVMTISGLALARSVESHTAAVSNLLLQQSAVRASDRALEQAYQWLRNQSANQAVLHGDSQSNGYQASRPTTITDQDWFHQASLWERARPAYAPGSSQAEDLQGNQAEYVIVRNCQGPGNPRTVKCLSSSALGTTTSGCGEGEDCGISPERPNRAKASVYYTIYAKVRGPRNTVSIVTSTVALPIP